MTIQVCCRNIYILNKWNALDEDNQHRLLGLGAHEPIPSFEMSQEDIQKAWPNRSSWEVWIVSPPFPGFDHNDYVAIYSLVATPNLEAIHWADITTADPQDDSDPAGMVFGSNSDPCTEEEPVRPRKPWSCNQSYQSNQEYLIGFRWLRLPSIQYDW